MNRYKGAVFFMFLAGGPAQGGLQDGQDGGHAAREGLASGIFAEEPNDDWGSLRADLDRALSEAQQTAVPQPDQSSSPQRSDGGGGEEAQIPQTDGASDRLPWQQAGWTLSPHISFPEHCKEGSTSYTNIPHSPFSVLAESAQEPAESSRSSSRDIALHSSGCRSGRRSSDIIFTPRRETATAGPKNQKVKYSKTTGHLHRRADRRLHRDERVPNLAHGRLSSTVNPQWIPQVDGSGDARPRRLGSSWNRGKGRLTRQPPPVGADDLQGREQSLEPTASQREAAEGEGSQKGNSQRYAALSMQQSPPKSALRSQAQNTGQPLLGKLDCSCRWQGPTWTLLAISSVSALSHVKAGFTRVCNVNNVCIQSQTFLMQYTACMQYSDDLSCSDLNSLSSLTRHALIHFMRVSEDQFAEYQLKLV